MPGQSTCTPVVASPGRSRPTTRPRTRGQAPTSVSRSHCAATPTRSRGAIGEDSSGVSETDNSATNAGAVYVYTRSGITWTQQAYVKASNTGTGDQSGFSVALSSNCNTLAVGAIGEDSSGVSETDNSATNAGAVYVYTRIGTAWTQQAYVKASNTGA